MPQGPYPVEQLLLDLSLAALPWLVLSAILNRWVFERATSQRGKYLAMPIAVLLNIALIGGVIPFLDSPAANEMTIIGAALGTMIGAPVGLMLSGRSTSPQANRELL